jgi:hypothetical protein
MCSKSNTCTSSKTLTSIGNTFSSTIIPTPTATTTESHKLSQELINTIPTPTSTLVLSTESTYNQSLPSQQNFIDYNIRSDDNDFEEQINLQNNTKKLNSYNIKLISLIPLQSNDSDSNTISYNSEYLDDYPEYREEKYKPPLPVYE